MALEVVAPWAEPVLQSADDLLSLSDDSWRYELVQGRLVRMPPTNLEHSDICGALYLALRSYVDQHGLGRVTMPETGFIVSGPDDPDTVLAPDLAFVRTGRLSNGGESARRFPRLAPDLVVEVASPSQHRPELSSKAQLWLRAGTRLVWVVWPPAQEVDVWEQGGAEVTTLAMGETLDGADVLPGFLLPLEGIWPVR
jgi:Uma2 family endonuclease